MKRLTEIPPTPESISIPDNNNINLHSDTANVIKAATYFANLYSELGTISEEGDDEVFSFVSDTKGHIDENAAILSASGADINNAVEDNKTELGAEELLYLKSLSQIAVSSLRYSQALNVFLISYLSVDDNDSKLESNKSKYQTAIQLAESDNLETDNINLLFLQIPRPTTNIDKKITTGSMEHQIINLSNKILKERSRLWSAAKLNADGRLRNDAVLAKKSLFEMLKCSCLTAIPSYPSSPQLEYLVNEIAELRHELHCVNSIDAYLCDAVGEGSLLSVDPDKVRNGTEIRFYKNELTKLEEIILDCSTSAHDIPTSRRLICSVKRALNGLHGLLLSRFKDYQQDLSSDSRTVEYQDLFSLCEAHLETAQAAERRLPSL